MRSTEDKPIAQTLRKSPRAQDSIGLEIPERCLVARGEGESTVIGAEGHACTVGKRTRRYVHQAEEAALIPVPYANLPAMRERRNPLSIRGKYDLLSGK